VILSQFEHWVGWGWGALFLVWAAGTVLILTVVYRWMLERFASRLPTAVIFVVWTLAVVAIGGRAFGYGPPPG
jgi:hypothetical protein